MANSLTSNVTRKLMQSFLTAFEANRVVSKSINTQLFQGKLNPSSGTTIDVKRPHDYVTARTSDGDLTSPGKSDIISGKATATVQNFFTSAAEWSGLEDAVQMDQLDEVIAPMATRIVTDLETDLAAYMMNTGGLSYGTPGQAVDAWSDVAGAGSLMDSLGVPKDKEWRYIANPYTTQALASSQATAISPASGSLVQTAWERATVGQFGGMRVMTSNALSNRTVMTSADMAGTLTGAPDHTYATAKDSMTQAWSVTAFGASTTIKKGDIIQVTGKYRRSNSTRLPVFDAAGDQILFRAVVTADVVLGASGEGTVVVTGPAIYEATGAYNTVDSAFTTDVVTVLGSTGDVVQPALFFHPDAFTMATVKLNKLYATDTVATTKDGLSLRCTKYSDGDKNKQMVRFDLLPAYGVLNPFFGGQGFGV